MSDERRTAEEGAGPNEPAGEHTIAPRRATDDTEGHGGKFPQPDPANRGGQPVEAADDDDTEGQGGKFPSPDPAYRGGQPVEAADDDDTEGQGGRFPQPA